MELNVELMRQWFVPEDWPLSLRPSDATASTAVERRSISAFSLQGSSLERTAVPCFF